MAERVTIQDIADALGLSRNTVSKAINNTGVLADSTRERVLQKAIEMGYKQFTYINAENLSLPNQHNTPIAQGEIAVLTCAKLGHSHFSVTMLDKFQCEMTKLGYSTTMHRVSSYELENLLLPNSFRKENTVAVMCIETFHYDYARMVCALDIPVLFVDHPVLDGRPLPADRLLMNNRDEIFSFIREMKNRNLTRIGFVGEYMHCQSFFERYMAFREGMYVNLLPIREEFCILEKANEPVPNESLAYQNYLCEHLKCLKELPDVLICANDFIAIDLLQAFRNLDISVPQDVLLCGFDDSPESRVITPPLTSIHIHGEILGLSAVDLILSRIRQPDLNYRTIYAETNLVYRKSTND